MHVPEGWEVKRLEELASVERGKFSARPRNDPQYYGGEIPFVQTGDIAEANTYLLEFSQTLNEQGLAVSRIFPKNTILITIAANIGDTAITTFDVACPDSLVAIQAKDGVDVFWLNSFIETKKEQLDGMATQNAQKNINLQALRPLTILVPPYKEQQKIAQILSTWDKAISTTEQLITISQLQKKALMQQLLTGKNRLLNKNGGRFSGEWHHTSLEMLGETYSGLSGKSKKDFDKGGKSYIPYMNIFSNSQIDITKFKYVQISENEHQTKVAYGDIFFTTSSETREEVGMSSVLLDEVNEVFLNSFCFGFRLHNFLQLTPQFARYLFRSEPIRRQISFLGQGATRYNLSKKQLLQLNLGFPSLEEQQKIAAVLSAADQEISVLQHKLDALKQEKKALMQQLLTGKRRVNS